MLIIDEIGKMELFSKEFEKKVIEVVENDVRLICTVPLKSAVSIIRQLKDSQDSILFTVIPT